VLCGVCVCVVCVCVCGVCVCVMCVCGVCVCGMYVVCVCVLCVCVCSYEICGQMNGTGKSHSLERQTAHVFSNIPILALALELYMEWQEARTGS